MLTWSYIWLAIIRHTLSTSNIYYKYMYVTEKAPFNEAQQICRNYGGRLARVTSSEVKEKLDLFFAEGGVWEGHPNDDFWMGLAVYEPCLEQSYLPYIWTDCSLYDETTAPISIEELNHRKNNENCFKVHKTDFNGKFKKCKDKSPYMCEIPIYGYTCPFHTIWSLTAVSSLSFNTSYCLAECSLLNDCMGVTIFGNTCSLLANNGSLLQQDVNATSAIYMEKNCEQATLVTNPDDIGITSNDDYSPLLFCDTNSVLNLTSPTDLCVAPTYPPVTDSWTTAGTGVTDPEIILPTTVDTSHVFNTTLCDTATTTATYTIYHTSTVHTSTVCDTATSTATYTIYHTNTVCDSSSTYSTYASFDSYSTELLTPTPSSSYIPTSTASVIDIHDLNRIVVNGIELSNVTCMLQTEYITPCLNESSILPIEETIMATPASVYNNCSSSVYIQCNSTKEKGTLEEEVREIVKNLTVDPKETTLFQNMFKCAEDARPSSQAVGIVGGMFVAIPVAFVIIIDTPGYFRFIRKIYRILKHSFVKKPKITTIRVVRTEPTVLFTGATPVYSSDSLPPWR